MKSRIFLLAGALALGSPSTFAWADSSATRTISTAGARAVEIEISAGDVVVVPDSAMASVDIRVESGGGATPSLPLRASHSSRGLKIAIGGSAAAVLPFAGGGGRAYEVHYPRALRLIVHQFGGSVTVRNASSPVEIYDSNGRVEVSNARAKLAAQTDNGNIVVTNAHATLELIAGSGDINAQLARDWSGDFVRIEASKGNLRLAVPRGFRARYDVSSGSGAVTNPYRSERRAPLVFMLAQTGNVIVAGDVVP